jgi:hypothetical protein
MKVLTSMASLGVTVYARTLLRAQTTRAITGHIYKITERNEDNIRSKGVSLFVTRVS